MSTQTAGAATGIRFLEDYPYVYSAMQGVNEVAVCVLVFAAEGTKLTYQPAGTWTGPDGLQCQSFEVSGIVFDGPPTNYHYLTFSFQLADEEQPAVYVYINYGDTQGDRRGTVSVPDSIGDGK